MAEEGRGPHFHHVPGLDGIRAFAVLAVIAFHSGFSWIPGGYYGVDAFFVLSGFLITSLLVAEWRGSGTVALGRFWARRARRLLPALFVLIFVIGLVSALWPSVLTTTHLVPSAVATTFYAANWYFAAGHTSYFNALSAPSPLLHTWSLAIEEQFYLVWPLVVLVVLGFRRRGARTPVVPSGADDLAGARADVEVPTGSGRGSSTENRRARRLELLAGLSVLGALASALVMAVVTPAGGDPNRAYYGTDTRAQGLLVGAALAAVFARFGAVRRPSGRRALGALAVGGVLGSALLWWRVPETSTLAFHGGFLLAALAAGAVIAGVVQAPHSPAAAALSWPPLRALGRISYGVYLWYWPVLLVMTGARTHLEGWTLFGARLVVTVVIAAASYTLIERPVRRGAFPGRWALVAAPAAAALALSVVVVGALLVPAAPELPAAAVAGSPAGVGQGALPARAHPVRALLVGDSVAGSLGVGLEREAARYDIELVNEGAPGCSVSMDQLIKVLWYTMAPGNPCRVGRPTALLNQWRTWVDSYRPDVVLYLARGELFNQEVIGRWSNLSSPRFGRYLAGRFRQAAAVLGSRGASVVFLTTPYYDSGEQPSGAPWPEDQPERVSLDNAIIHQVARSSAAVARRSVRSTSVAADPAPTPHVPTVGPAVPAVSVYNLGTVVSPGGHYDRYVDGVEMRCDDGVHFTVAGGEWLGRRLLPVVAALGRDNHVAGSTGSWPTRLPPAVPSWWSKLACT